MEKDNAREAAYNRFHNKYAVTNGELGFAMQCFYAGWRAAKRHTRKKRKK